MTDDKRNEWLGALTAGDVVAYDDGHWGDDRHVRAVVARRTPTRIVLRIGDREEWVHAKDGRGSRRGGSFSVPPRITEMTPGITEAIERRALIAKLRAVHWDAVPTDELRAAWTAVRDADRAMGRVKA